MRGFRRHRAGEQGDEAPPTAPPTLSSVPEWDGKTVRTRVNLRRRNAVASALSLWGRSPRLQASLRCPLDSTLLWSVKLIETAMRCETVAENSQCRVPTRGPNDCRNRQAYSRRDVLGCSRKEKNGSTTSKTKTVTTIQSPDSCARHDNPTLGQTKPLVASALGVRTKKRQDPLDKSGSFRDGASVRFSLQYGGTKNTSARAVDRQARSTTMRIAFQKPSGARLVAAFITILNIFGNLPWSVPGFAESC